MATTAPVKFYVSDGPSADRVIDALKYAFVKGSVLTVTFSGALSTGPRSTLHREFVAQITGVRYESGDEGMFMVEGANVTAGGNFQGHYNAKTRKGTFTMKR